MAIPADDGGVELYAATQGLDDDLRQVATCLRLPEDKVRITLAGVGGTFGAREDISMEVHVCLLALRWAVKSACEAVRDEVCARARALTGCTEPDLRLEGGKVLTASGEPVADLVEVLDAPIERTVEWRHRPTQPLDAQTGQGDAHVQWGLCAHRAVVDVDVELGLVKVIELAAAEDVGRAINPQGVEGQIHGGSTQGLGLALMEEIQVSEGRVRNPSFTDYLIPTILDTPPMPVEILELADPFSPYGLRGVGEPSTISATPAVVAAVRAATGQLLERIPIRPEHITNRPR